MKIVIDGRMIGWTGIGRYTLELLNQLQSLDTDNHYVVLMLERDWDSWKPSTPNFNRVRVNAQPYSFAEQLKLPLTLWQLKPDVVHFLSFNSPILYFGKRVTTVHDLTLLDFSVSRGNLLKRGRYWAKRRVAHLALRFATLQSNHLITDTEFVRHQLIERGYATPSKSSSIHLGVSLSHDRPTTKAPSMIERPYMMYVGNFYPNKNILRLIAAMPDIRSAHPTVKLVLVGNPEGYTGELKHHIKRAGLENVIILTGRVTDEELLNLYSQASLYVLPSLSEGFGLPALEAMQQGVPVASSNATCLPEVYGDAAAYFDPTNTKNMAQVISDTLADTQLLHQLKAAGFKRIKQFSWKQMTQQTLQIYKDVVKN